MASQNGESCGVVEIRIPARPAYLAVVRSAVETLTERFGFEQDEMDRLILALDEAMGNCIKHSYDGPCDKLIVVTIRQTGDKEGEGGELEFVVRDFGKQVDPAQIRSRDLDNVRPGGLGVHIMQSAMDEVEYSRAPGEGMMVRLVKRLHGASSM